MRSNRKFYLLTAVFFLTAGALYFVATHSHRGESSAPVTGQVVAEKANLLKSVVANSETVSASGSPTSAAPRPLPEILGALSNLGSEDAAGLEALTNEAGRAVAENETAFVDVLVRSVGARPFPMKQGFFLTRTFVAYGTNMDLLIPVLHASAKHDPESINMLKAYALEQMRVRFEKNGDRNEREALTREVTRLAETERDLALVNQALHILPHLSKNGRDLRDELLSRRSPEELSRLGPFN